MEMLVILFLRDFASMLSLAWIILISLVFVNAYLMVQGFAALLWKSFLPPNIVGFTEVLNT